jgi:DNA-binding CsgD family transcriptional regulator
VEADRYFPGCPVVFHLVDQGSNEGFLLRCRELFPQGIEPEQGGLNLGRIRHRLIRRSGFYGTLDPLKTAGLARHRHPGPDTVYTGEQLIEPAEIRKTEFYNDFLLPNQMVHHFGSPLAIHPQWVSNLSSHRPGRREPFGPIEVDLLKLLLPHLQRAVQFHRRFVELQGQQRASLDALDRLPIGVVLLDQNTRIVAVNREAQTLLDQNDGLSVDKEGLSAAISSENRELRITIAGAIKTAIGQGMEAGGILAISRPSGRRPFALLVEPVGRQAFAPGIEAPSVIVFVGDPERKHENPSQALARLYELSAAEVRLAELLMRGETVVKSAEQLGISHNTARTHLQRIYEKTNTTHQGQLIRLIVTGVTTLLRNKGSN